MTEAVATQIEAPPPASPLAGIGITVVVLVGIIGWIALGSMFLAETSLFGGFLMLWYWAKVEHLDVKRLPASLLGALVGIGLAWGVVYGASSYGGLGLAVGLILMILAIYLDIVQQLPLFVNASTMLYLTVAAAPLVQLKVDWVELCLATLGGGIFFAAFVAGATWLATKVFQGKAHG